MTCVPTRREIEGFIHTKNGNRLISCPVQKQGKVTDIGLPDTVKTIEKVAIFTFACGYGTIILKVWKKMVRRNRKLVGAKLFMGGIL